MVKFFDNFLNNITMYRLVLYYLIFLLLAATVFSWLGILPFGPFALIFSVFFLVAICWVTNIIFAKVFGAVTNVESVYISALILALLIAPIKSVPDLPFLFWAAVLTSASKYIFAINKKHIFNPVALAVFLTAIFLNRSANWWVGTLAMMPFVLAGGILIVKKIRRLDLVWSFWVTSLVTILGFTLLKGGDLISTAQHALVYSPLLFLALVMLTEPLTTPPTKKLQVMYGVLVGFLFAPQIHLGSFYSTPEVALLAGNVFSYLVSPKGKLILKLKEKIQIAPDIYDFIFQRSEGSKGLSFLPGQYLEWTLGHNNPDGRGNRRYFTIASSSTEADLRIGVKFYPRSSSFKKALWSMTTGSEIVASQLSGDFVLPKNPGQKLVFVAGGIGITPFRSMIKYLLDTNQKRPIILFYANKTSTELVYDDIIRQAVQQLGMKVVYILTETEQIPSTWQGKRGRISEQMIREEVPDYKERLFYLSGPHQMVASFEETLSKMGINQGRVKVDYFPGFV